MVNECELLAVCWMRIYLCVVESSKTNAYGKVEEED